VTSSGCNHSPTEAGFKTERTVQKAVLKKMGLKSEHGVLGKYWFMFCSHTHFRCFSQTSFVLISSDDKREITNSFLRLQRHLLS